MLCRVCAFPVMVWQSYRTFRSTGTGMEVLQNSQGSGYCGTGAQNSHKFRAGTKNAVPVPRVLWYGAYRTHRLSGYGYEYPTELTEVPGTGMKVLQNFQKFRVLWHGRTELTEFSGRCKNAVPVSRLLWQGRTDLTQLPGTGMNVVQNSHKFFVRVWMLYRTHRSSGYG